MKYELYSGAGNDFVMINNFRGSIPVNEQKALTIKLCNENFPEIDGVIFVDKPLYGGDAIRMSYYNRDGSFGAMCGNGARCTAMFAHKHGIITNSEFILEAVDDKYSAKIIDEINVTIGFPEPKEIKNNLKLEIVNENSAGTVSVSYANVGSDHIVIFVDEDTNKDFLNGQNMAGLNVNGIGKMLRFYKALEPRGANVNFAEVQSDGVIRLRTYERGVERETLACGTGIISTGIIAMMNKGLKPPVKVKVQSGEILQVDAKIVEGKITALSLTGSAKKFGEGEI